jgi:hypothetical protein
MVGERERHNRPPDPHLGAAGPHYPLRPLWEGVTLSDEHARSRFRECHTRPGRLRAVRAVGGSCWWVMAAVAVLTLDPARDPVLADVALAGRGGGLCLGIT